LTGADLPGGTVTLLFTDVDSSSELVKRLGERYGAVLATHRDLLRTAFAAHGGVEIDTQGDSFFVVFERARDAVEAAAAIQRSLLEHPWPDDVGIAVRIGLHTGEPHQAEHGYVGLAVHRAARICTIAHGGQVLLSRATAGIVDDELIPGVSIRDLGTQTLKDIDRPEHVFQLVVAGLQADFPPLRTIDQQLPLTGTVTLVMAEGRRMMRLAMELPPDVFGALLADYQRLLCGLLEGLEGREVDAVHDTVTAAFPTAREAVVAAAAARKTFAAQEWPEWPEPGISLGLHSGEAGVGWAGPASLHCAVLCDAAEAGEIFLSQVTAGLLEGQDLGALFLRDLGERRTRRGDRAVRAWELLEQS
jgi:class 3 adenylate cyclase